MLITMVALDLAAFGGRYSARSWSYAQQTGLSFHYEIARIVALTGS